MSNFNTFITELAKAVVTVSTRIATLSYKSI